MTDNSTILADTLQGKVEGIYENGQNAFKGIPYEKERRIRDAFDILITTPI
jgi:carboxylesterase type B